MLRLFVPSRPTPTRHAREEAQPARDPDRRPALRRVRRGRPSVHEDAQRRPARERGRAVRARVPHDADLLAQPRVDHERPVREPPRDHRQRRPRRDEPPAAELPPGAAATGLPDRAHRQVAHGQRRDAAARLRLLGELRRPRQAHGPDAQPRRAPRPAQGLHHRHHEPARGRVPRAQAGQAVLAVLRAQGRPPGRGAGGRRHAAHLGAGRLRRRRPAQAPLPRRRVPADAEHDDARRGRPAQARLGRMLRDEDQRDRTQDPRRAQVGVAGGDPRARADDGGGRRGDGRDLRGARAAGRARQHVRRVRQRQRVLLRRARARARAALRVRGGDPLAVPRALSAAREGGDAPARPRDLPGHRADDDRARGREAGAADPGPVAAAALRARFEAGAQAAAAPAGASRSWSSTGPSRRCPGSSA